MVKDEEKKEVNNNTIAVVNHLLKSLFLICLRSLRLCGNLREAATPLRLKNYFSQLLQRLLYIGITNY